MQQLAQLMDLPKADWHCVTVLDKGKALVVCDVCLVQKLRFVHVMTHPQLAQPLMVGCVCAAKLDGHLERAREREQQARSRSHRRKCWLERAWKPSKTKAGVYWLKERGFICSVYPKRNGFGATVTVSRNGEATHSRTIYPTPPIAQLACFDFIERTKAKLDDLTSGK